MFWQLAHFGMHKQPLIYFVPSTKTYIPQVDIRPYLLSSEKKMLQAQVQKNLQQ